MRGEEGFYERTGLRTGITPACAGRSAGDHSAPAMHRDHPRVCGEKGSFRYALRDLGGSPPRVRGEACSLSPAVDMPRITPACAGRSDAQHRRCFKWQDHPRVCGEKKRARLTRSWSTGSPPRVRGEAGDLEAVQRDLGITPACAGRSASITEPQCLQKDHPRVCGEKGLGCHQ